MLSNTTTYWKQQKIVPANKTVPWCSAHHQNLYDIGCNIVTYGGRYVYAFNYNFIDLNLRQREIRWFRKWNDICKNTRTIERVSSNAHLHSYGCRSIGKVRTTPLLDYQDHFYILWEFHHSHLRRERYSNNRFKARGGYRLWIIGSTELNILDMKHRYICRKKSL